ETAAAHQNMRDDALGELKIGDTGRALISCGEGSRTRLPVISHFNGSLDILRYPESHETIIEGCHLLIDHDVAGFISDPDIKNLVGEFSHTSCQAVIKALMSGGHIRGNRDISFPVR